MEEMDAEPAGRVGRVTVELGGRLGVAEGPRLARGVGVALFAASVTGARGFADVEDFNDDAESGEVMEGRPTGVADGEGLFAVDADRGGLAEGPKVDEREGGAIEVLRDGAEGVEPGVARVVGGGGMVALLGVAVVALTVRLTVEAVGDLTVAEEAGALLAAAGAPLAVPGPNVPELTIYEQHTCVCHLSLDVAMACRNRTTYLLDERCWRPTCGFADRFRVYRGFRGDFASCRARRRRRGLLCPFRGNISRIGYSRFCCGGDLCF